MTTNIDEAAAAAAAEVAAAEERKRLFERHRDDLSKREISNAENHDKSILTYSAAGLGLSLGLLKDFIPIAQAQYSLALYWSWIFFVLAMISVIASYPISQIVIAIQHDRAKRYYLDNIESAGKERTKLECFADILNRWISPASFIVAIVLTIFFVSTNLKGANVANKNATLSIAQEALTGMQMQPATQQQANTQKSAANTSIQTATASQPAAASAQKLQNKSQQGGAASQAKPSN